ncbi:hypothetical protein L7F22_008821 [Adiantum nelumboides]|nr:hypothetical protein [Adiantum nelumboides]
MPPPFPWSGRKPSSEEKPAREPHPDSVALDIADTPGSGNYGGSSIRAHFSPFAPTVSGAITRRGSGAISSMLSGMPPGPVTPPSSRYEAPGPKRSTRRQQRKQERRAAPEKVLTLFAMRLAVLEKIASNVGTLAFIWATVVLLGGFAITLKEIDFWFVTVILVIEGARIFSRSHELEWQHQDAGTAAGSLFVRAYQRSSDVFFRSTRKIVSTLTMGRNGADGKLQAGLESPLPAQPGAQNRTGQPGDHHLQRTWSVSRVPLVPVLDWIFRAKHISRLLYWMQLISACVATALAVYRLRVRNFTRENEVDTVSNHAAALLIFYSMAAFEALVFLFERSYWQFQISARKILVRVNEMCGLQSQDLGTTRRFFYDVYSKCLNDSIFEGLKMDMVDYALTWLQSDIPGEQLGGLRVLRTFSWKDEFAEETLRSIGVKQGAVERLLEMVTWKNPVEHEVRKTAADLLSKLVKYNQYSSRVAAISSSIDSIFTLLARDANDNSPVAELYTREGAAEPLAPKHIETNIVGLRILKNLAKDPLICAKIGATRGLLSRLVSFIDTSPAMLRNAEEPEYRIQIVKKSLELLNLLASASGSSGKMLREEIARIVYTVSNLKIILEYGQAHMMLQDVATEILCSLAMDDDMRETIGRTGGVMRTLFALLMKERVDGDSRQMGLMQKAGEALALLALKSRENCLKMLRLKVRQGGTVVEEDGEEEEEAFGGKGGHDREVMVALMEMVGDWEVGDLAMCILRSLCAYSENEWCKARVGRGVVRKAMRLAVERGGRSQEAAVGLVAVAVGKVGEAELRGMMEVEGVTAEGLGAKLARLLERHPRPMTALPRLRRYAVELVLALAEHHPATFLPVFQALRIRSLLHRLADSVAELENYATFSGATGVTPHAIPMSRLLDIAIDRFRRLTPLSSPTT